METPSNPPSQAARPLDEIIEAQRAFHATQVTLSAEFRAQQLMALQNALDTHESELLSALHADLRKGAHEAYVTELGFIKAEIAYALRYLKRWMRPRRVGAPLLVWPSRALVYPEPYGVVLIIGPWNYPVQLALGPLVGAIAAGNCACIKPSELAPATSAALSRLVRTTFPWSYVAVVEGGRETAKELLTRHFDCVFFTGSGAVGRRVLEASAQTLTPVTLELGGKNPCIVCKDAPLEIAARRIAWGKWLNAGQTCIAPDILFVDEGIKGALLHSLAEVLKAFYPDSPRRSPDFGRIVNRAHYERLCGYLREGRIALGGEHDPDELFIEPTVLEDLAADAVALREEIFGPILPLVTFSELDDVLQRMRSCPAPLALYLFSRDRCIHRRVLAATRSGGVCINDTMSHAFCKRLPFGGFGASGMGSYHGKAGFECFTHYRSVLVRATWPDFRFRYPPVRTSLTLLKAAYRVMTRE